MKAFGGAGVGRPATRTEPAARAAEQAPHARTTIAALGDRGKTDLLARAIVKAATLRGMVSLLDLRQAGVSAADCERLYDDAFAAARAYFPAVDQIGAMP